MPRSRPSFRVSNILLERELAHQADNSGGTERTFSYFWLAVEILVGAS